MEDLVTRRGVTVADLRQRLAYDPASGSLQRRSPDVALTRDEDGPRLLVKGEGFPQGAVIFALMTGRWPLRNKIIDHRNFRYDDFRWENLFETSRAESLARKLRRAG
jgi:hypothetical protein